MQDAPLTDPWVQHRPAVARGRKPRIRKKRRVKRLAAWARLQLRRMKLGTLRKLIIAGLGGSVFLVGLAMVVLPGPAIVVIPLGLTILATEFVWARRWLKKARSLLPKGKTESPPPGR